MSPFQICLTLDLSPQDLLLTEKRVMHKKLASKHFQDCLSQSPLPLLPLLLDSIIDPSTTSSF